MRFTAPLVPGRLVKRYKRFLADVRLESGEVVTAHTANPGRMIGLIEPGRRVYLLRNDDPKRKLRYTWELLEIDGQLLGINPARANAIVGEAIERGGIPELMGYGSLRAEVRYGQRKSRIDFLLEDCDAPEGREPQPPCYVEVKNVTLLEGEGALFPDAVTERGRKHLLELADVAERGDRAVLVFLVQRPEPTWVGPADAIDPAYAQTLREVLAAGVEALAYRARVSLEEIVLTERLPVRAEAQAPGAEERA